MVFHHRNRDITKTATVTHFQENTLLATIRIITRVVEFVTRKLYEECLGNQSSQGTEHKGTEVCHAPWQSEWGLHAKTSLIKHRKENKWPQMIETDMGRYLTKNTCEVSLPRKDCTWMWCFKWEMYPHRFVYLNIWASSRIKKKQVNAILPHPTPKKCSGYDFWS